MNVLWSIKTKPYLWFDKLKIKGGSGHNFKVQFKIFEPDFLSFPKSKLKNLSGYLQENFLNFLNHP